MDSSVIPAPLTIYKCLWCRWHGSDPKLGDGRWQCPCCDSSYPNHQPAIPASGDAEKLAKRFRNEMRGHLSNLPSKHAISQAEATVEDFIAATIGHCVCFGSRDCPHGESLLEAESRRLAGEVAQEQAARLDEVEHWVARYNEVEQWRISTRQRAEQLAAEVAQLQQERAESVEWYAANRYRERAEAAEGEVARLREQIEKAFKAGYHCQWIREEMRYIFDPSMKPGDPDGAFETWKNFQNDLV